ncbi:DNA repair protein RadA [Clostridiales bacterium PH28_bin88]|nr:DNA repair protein RadA [Clostridiales bacterium PH28_bin88]
MATRPKVRFVCQQCGHESAKWLGRCPACESWNSLVEERVMASGPVPRGVSTANLPVAVTEITCGSTTRFSTGLGELDRVLGGGVVPGSLVLVGGDPGIGKSTLLLQAADRVARSHGTVLYVSGEESVEQVRMRAERLQALHPSLFLAAESGMESVTGFIAGMEPGLVIIDSIQTMYLPDLPSAPGSVGQVRECAARLLHVAKGQNIPVVLVGHVTKEGNLAGPRVLEHMVDTVLYFEGERHHAFRILRAVKNRFGSTNEIGVFEMSDGGLREVANPSEVFLAQRPLGATGSVVVASMEGTRPVLLEVQALVAGNAYNNPRRLVTGLDWNRALLMVAVLDKRIGLNLGGCDVYLNVAGGVRAEEPALDLGICLAIASSLKNRPVDQFTTVIGEVGLTGEVRAVSQLEARVKEAAKLGFKRCVVPRNNSKQPFQQGGMTVFPVGSLEDALEVSFGG